MTAAAPAAPTTMEERVQEALALLQTSRNADQERVSRLLAELTPSERAAWDRARERKAPTEPTIPHDQ